MNQTLKIQVKSQFLSNSENSELICELCVHRNQNSHPRSCCKFDAWKDAAIRIPQSRSHVPRRAKNPKRNYSLPESHWPPSTRLTDHQVPDFWHNFIQIFLNGNVCNLVFGGQWIWYLVVSEIWRYLDYFWHRMRIFEAELFTMILL